MSIILAIARLDTLAIDDIINAVQPDTLYISYADDIHTDHGVSMPVQAL